jgi:hypothetical protein
MFILAIAACSRGSERLATWHLLDAINPWQEFFVQSLAADFPRVVALESLQKTYCVQAEK